MPKTDRAFQIGDDLDKLLHAYDVARWRWERWSLKHIIFVKVSQNRGTIITRLKGYS